MLLENTKGIGKEHFPTLLTLQTDDVSCEKLQYLATILPIFNCSEKMLFQYRDILRIYSNTITRY